VGFYRAYIYDKTGNILENTFFYSAGLFYCKDTYVYNEEGQTPEHTSDNINSIHDDNFYKKYDERGNLLQDIRFDAAEDTTLINTNIYDENNNNIENHTESKLREHHYKHINEYDKNNNLEKSNLNLRHCRSYLYLRQCRFSSFPLQLGSLLRFIISYADSHNFRVFTVDVGRKRIFRDASWILPVSCQQSQRGCE
jgi:hypothetical protein